jgi:hypothetical protein
MVAPDATDETGRMGANALRSNYIARRLDQTKHHLQWTRKSGIVPRDVLGNLMT